jgi:hypothetical protein
MDILKDVAFQEPEMNMMAKRAEKSICIITNNFDPLVMKSHWDLQLLHFSQILFDAGYILEIITKSQSERSDRNSESFAYGRMHRIQTDSEWMAICNTVHPDLFIVQDRNDFLNKVYKYLNDHQMPVVVIVRDKTEFNFNYDLKRFWANGHGMVAKFLGVPGILKKQYCAHRCFQNFHVLVQDPQLQELYGHRYSRPAFFIPSLTDCQDSIPEKQGPQKILCLVNDNEHELLMFRQLLKFLHEKISDWIVLAIDLPHDQIAAWQKKRIIVLSSWDRDQIHDLLDSVDCVVSLHGFDEMFVHAWARFCTTIAYSQAGDPVWNVPDFVQTVRNLCNLVHAVDHSKTSHPKKQKLTQQAMEYTFTRHSIQANKQRLLSYIDGLITVYDKDF